MASDRQSELAIVPTNTMATLESSNVCSEDGNAHGENQGEIGMVSDSNRQESINGSSTINLPGSSPESRVTVDFELLWKLRKYLVLLGALAVGVTYNAGLTPPGGFWSHNRTGRDGHNAGDSVLRARFFLRHEVFFYCNATAFAASLVLIILLLSKHVTRQKLWLRSMQLTMILDLFSLMGAYAAGSCRAVKSSIYIWILVFTVFVYIMIHILIFIRVVPRFVSIKEVVPKWLKEKAQAALYWILSNCVHESQGSSSQDNDVEAANKAENDVEEARKFILMLVTFAATVTYQAGLSPPGGFWTENDQKKDPATSMLRSENLSRYNTFVICNSTSFVASLVTIILLLSPELSRHGIRSKALTVCVIVDLLGLIGAYATGSCRSVVTSAGVVSIIVIVWIFFAILTGTFVHKPVADWLGNIEPAFKKCAHIIGRVFSLEPLRNRSRSRDATEPQGASNQENQLSYHQQALNIQESESHGKHQTAGKQQTVNAEEDMSASEHALMTGVQSKNNNNDMSNREDQSIDRKSAAKEPTSKTEYLLIANVRVQSSPIDDLKTTNSATKEPIPQTENPLNANMMEQSLSMDDLKKTKSMNGTSKCEHQSADTELVANITGQYSLASDQIATVMPGVNMSKESVLARSCNGATNGLTAEKESTDAPMNAVEREIVETNGDTRHFVDGNTNNNGAPRQYESNENQGGNITDDHLKKSRTYLLLLAILAVSLTYQSGLNPPGGFWSKREDNNSTGAPIPIGIHHRLYHLPGDPILEDTHHHRYIAFFYLNAIAFVASLVMIILLLNREVSSLVTKRYALQVAMIVDLLALTGSYVMGSCRERKNSIYILLLVCLVLAYVALHVLIAVHVIPEGWRKAVADKFENFSCRYIWTKQPPSGQNERGYANDMDCEVGHNPVSNAKYKDWERRRNLLLILAVLAATVTYQAGMNPPGGVWSDDKEVSGKHGDPILQHNYLKRYDVFFYTNSISFVSSVVITILLVNKESCEHGIKSYALRVCLVVGLVGLLVAYSAGSCRKAKQSIYLIIIAVAVLISLVIQVLLLSSTQGTLGAPIGKFIEQLLFGKEEVRQETSRKQESSGHPTKEDQKSHKYLMLLAILAASITYQAGLNPPGGIWSDDDAQGHVAGNPVLLDTHPRRYHIFFWFNSISLMTSIMVIMYLLNRSVWNKDVPIRVLHIIMVLDLLALMTAFAAGSCRKFRTSVYVYALVVGVVIYLVIVLFLSKGIAKCLRTNTPIPGEQV